MQAVMCFTDFHLVIYPDNEDTTVIVGGIETDMYPSGSHIDNFKNFIKEMPQSKYTKMLKTILKNPSTIEYSDDYLLYLVVLGFEEDYDKTEEKLFAYAEKGIDIPHHIIISGGEDSQNAIVYRFFTDQDRALKALQTIKKDYKNAQIIAIDRSGKRIALSDK